MGEGGDLGPAPGAGDANLDQLGFGTTPVGASPAAPPTAARSTCSATSGSGRRASFGGYPGFLAYPYREYSEVFFGSGYSVLRGGSWATQPRVATPTFRNWDLPQRRQIFAGVRLASTRSEHEHGRSTPDEAAVDDPNRTCVRGDERTLADDVLDGLTRPFKELPPKHFYDARGSELFDRICELPEYYPTRTERSILAARARRSSQLDAAPTSSSSSARARRTRRASCSTRCPPRGRCAATSRSTSSEGMVARLRRAS